MCNCVELMNDELKKFNTKLVIPIAVSQDGLRSLPPQIATEKIDSKVRKGPASVLPSFCPFCGEKYSE